MGQIKNIKLHIVTDIKVSQHKDKSQVLSEGKWSERTLK